MPESWSVRHATARLATTAEAVFAHLYGDRDVAVWLDSARESSREGRFSVLGSIECTLDYRVRFASATQTIQIDDLPPTPVDDVWQWLGRRLAERHLPAAPDGLPFVGGFVGYAGYGAPGDTAGRRPDPQGPDLEFLHLTRFIVIDHLAELLHVVAIGSDDDGWISETLHRIEDAPPPLPLPQLPSSRPACATVTPARYLRDLDTVRGWLLAGDSYEACYTYALTFDSAEDPFVTYRRLRTDNPAQFAAFLRFGTRAVLSCSPERYLRVAADGMAESKPIKGTAKRADDEKEDARIAAELQSDPKSRSENLMIVDLVRNDLGRICLPGTVAVPSLMAVETYATVHQLVSTITGRLEPGGDSAARAAGALFPAGSMTGAPKHRTVALLDALEAEPRGVYSGAIGFLSYSGDVELSVVIRTAVVDGARVRIGTGGAITIDSDPIAEREETITKAGAMLAPFARTHPFVYPAM